MSTKRFLGCDTDETGKLVINRTQEPIVVRLYQEFLDGKTTDYIMRIFERKGWRSSTGVDRKVWQCSERYKVKGVMGCANGHVEEETLIKVYLMAWNALVENREDFITVNGTEIECKNEEE